MEKLVVNGKINETDKMANVIELNKDYNDKMRAKRNRAKANSRKRKVRRRVSMVFNIAIVIFCIVAFFTLLDSSSYVEGNVVSSTIVGCIIVFLGTSSLGRILCSLS